MFLIELETKHEILHARNLVLDISFYNYPQKCFFCDSLFIEEQIQRNECMTNQISAFAILIPVQMDEHKCMQFI